MLLAHNSDYLGINGIDLDIKLIISLGFYLIVQHFSIDVGLQGYLFQVCVHNWHDQIINQYFENYTNRGSINVASQMVHHS